MGRIGLLVVLAVTWVHGSVAAANEARAALRSFEPGERLGQRAALETRWIGEDGTELRFGSLFDGRHPVLLSLNYFSCRGLCDMQLRGLARGLAALGETPGESFRLVTVSIEPDERAAVLRERARALRALLGKPAAEWHVLRGAAPQISALARSVGFVYEHDADTRQYAHAPLLIVLASDGRIVRHLHGLEYAPRDLKLALIEAAQGRVGAGIDSVLLSCFEFDSATGRYSLAVWRLVRVGGALTLLAMLAAFAKLRRRERPGAPRRRAPGGVHER